MTVRRSEDGRVVLEGACPIEDAEPLLQLLLADRRGAVDWRACETAHTAVLQVLLAAGTTIIGPPAGAFLRDHIAAALAQAGS